MAECKRIDNPQFELSLSFNEAEKLYQVCLHNGHYGNLFDVQQALTGLGAGFSDAELDLTNGKET